MFCKYKDILGVSRQGVHSIRFMDFAVVDVVLTIILSFFISYFFKFPFGITLLFTFISGIILHKLFCVKTKVSTILNI
jgi:uncharacterized integral membrane protein